MRLKSFVRSMGVKPLPGSSVQAAALSGAFCLGMLGGYLYAAFCYGRDVLVLKDYLNEYCQLFQSGGDSKVSLLSAVQLYFAYPAAVFLLGFTAFGVLAIPLAGAAFGFTSMFAVACFVHCYGQYGALLALCAMGVRMLFSLPCFLWLGSHAWVSSAALMPGGNGKRCAPAVFDGMCWSRLLVCVVFLCIGVCCERALTPYLFHLALMGLS